MVTTEASTQIKVTSPPMDFSPPVQCGTCEVTEQLTECPLCALPHCTTHTLVHLKWQHSDDQATKKAISARVTEAAMNGLSAFRVPGTLFTAGAFHSDPNQSVWFIQAEMLGLQHPCIINWRPSSPGDPEAEEFREQVIRTFIEDMDLQIYDFLPTSNHTLFCAESSNIKLDQAEAQSIAPTEFTFDPEDETPTASDENGGYVNDAGSPAGKIIKRHKVKTVAQAAIAHDEPSPAGQLVTTLHRIRYRIVDTNGAGDGTGMIRQSIADALLEEGGSDPVKDMLRLQIVAIGSQEGVKGMPNVIPEHMWTDPDYDMILDDECKFINVLHSVYTVIKMRAIRHRSNLRSFLMDGLMYQQIVCSLLGHTQIVDQAHVIADEMESSVLQRVLAGDYDEEWFRPIRYLEWDQDTNFKSKHQEHTLLAYNASWYSPFASPNVMEQTTGQLYKHVKAVLRRKKSVPSILVSGEAVWYQHYAFCKNPDGSTVSSPKPGYARLIWHLERPDQLVGLAMNKRDIKRSYQSLDTPDKDDLFFLICFIDTDGKPCVLVLRMPSSIGGGYVLKLNRSDAKHLKEIGYHFYQQTGEPRYPGIYDEDEQGNPLFPDVLEPQVFQNPPTWPVEHKEAITTMMTLTRYRSVIGEACNLTANLDFAGAYDPTKHKFNFSSAVIDPAYMCSADPSTVLVPLRHDLLDHILAGGTVDPCIYGRIEESINDLYRERQLNDGVAKNRVKELMVSQKCGDACQPFKKAMSEIRQTLAQRLTRRQALANGPSHRLVDGNFHADLVDIVTMAVATRDSVWSEHSREKNRIDNR